MKIIGCLICLVISNLICEHILHGSEPGWYKVVIDRTYFQAIALVLYAQFWK